MKNISIVVIALFLFAACEKTITLDLGQTDELVVIEGLISNEVRRQSIKLSRIQPYDATGGYPAVAGAGVKVEDDKGTLFEFEETEPGLYLSKEPFAAEVGAMYFMTVELDGEIFTAAEDLRPIASIDTLIPVIDEKEMEKPADEGKFYQVLVFMQEPRETEDYYLFKFYRNDTIQDEKGTIIYVFDDTILGEDINALPLPVYYGKGDTARIEIFSLSPQSYRYYFDLSININNDGGMFSGQPANTSTNIKGGAIGYFQVSSVEIGEIRVE